MKCPHCGKDIAEKIIGSWWGMILHKRRCKMPPEEARAKQVKSVEARNKKRMSNIEHRTSNIEGESKP